MKKIKVDDTIYENITNLTKNGKYTIAEVVAQKFSTPAQYDSTTKDGVLRKVYYYQKRTYGDVPSLKKFLKKWKKDSKFKEIWDDYENMGYKDAHGPTFFRWGSDTQTEKLYIARKGNVKKERDSLRSRK